MAQPEKMLKTKVFVSVKFTEATKNITLLYTETFQWVDKPIEIF